MKKTIFILLLFIINNNVYANNLNTWQEEKINDPKLNEEMEIKYKWYKEEKVGEYLLTNENHNYQLKEENNIKYGEFSEWIKECPNESYYEIENKLLYPYKKINKIKYIQFNVTRNPIYISNIKIFINDIEINNYYTTYTNATLYYNSSLIEYYFNEEYDAESIKILMESSINNPFTDIVTVSFFTIDNKKLFLSHFRDNIEVTAVSLLTDDYSNKINYDDNINDIQKIKWIKIYNQENLCRYRPKYQYYYNINKVYYDNNYYTYIDNYIKDENNYKIYYKYTKKDNSIPIETKNLMLNTDQQSTNNNLNQLELPEVMDINSNQIRTSEILELNPEITNNDNVPILNKTAPNKVINELKIDTKIDNIYIIAIATVCILLLSILKFKNYVKKKKYMI